MDCKARRCLASPVCLITLWVKHSWYTRSVQYLISQQRLHDGTDAQTLYVPHESKADDHESCWAEWGGVGWGGLFGCKLWVDIFGLFTYALKVESKIKNKIKKKRRRRVRMCIMSQSWKQGLNTSVVYIQGHCKLKVRAATLVMRQGWPLPQCHISSENLTWHVCIGFLHLPFKPLWASWRWGELRSLSPRFSAELFFMHTLTDVDIWLGGVHRSPWLSGASASLFSES